MDACDESSRRRRVGRYSIRWEPARASAAYSSGWWVRQTLCDELQRAAMNDPERMLVVDKGVRLNAGRLHAKAKSLASALVERVPIGSVVSFMLPNWHEAAVIYHGISLAGMVAHPILPSLREQELSFMLRDVDSRAIFIPGEYRNHDYRLMIERVLRKLDPRPAVFVVRDHPGSHAGYSDLFETYSVAKLSSVEADSVRLVLYTSGTTGRSKGVLHTYNTIHALMRQIGANWRVEAGDTFLVPSPISHIGGSIYAFEGPLLLKTTAVLMDRWDPEESLHLAETEGCTHICGATPFLSQLLDAARRADKCLPALKLFVCGGASVPPSLIRAAAAQFQNAAVTRVYGSTEVPVTTVGCPDRADLARASETDGRPGVAEVKLVASPAASPGEGEIFVRGPQMLVGYVHPNDECDLFDADGYYRTGDLGRWSDGEYLVVSGRAKDIIIRNGENIAPKEVEDILVNHPQIEEVAIVGLPDAKTGERACAVIVVKTMPAPDVKSLSEFLTANGVALFKSPEQVVVWEALPKNDAGKVLKHQIRAALAGPLETG